MIENENENILLKINDHAEEMVNIPAGAELTCMGEN